MSITTYALVRNRIKTADLIEFAADSILGKTIRWKTGQNVNHTASAIWHQNIDGMGSTYRGGKRLYVGEALATGYQLTYLSQDLKKYDGKVYWSALKPEYDHLRLEIAYHLQQLEGRPYDFTSLIRNLWRRVPLDATRPYCSEANQIAAINAGALNRDFSPTGKDKHRGCGLWPGEFSKTGLYEKPIQIL